MTQVKRIILRLAASDYNASDPHEAVRLYLTKKGYSLHDLDTGRHAVHIQQPNLSLLPAHPKVHIVIDVERGSRGEGEEVPMEFYRVCRRDGELVMMDFKDRTWFRNYACQMRVISKEMYP